MFCDEALDAVEAIAAGELTREGRIAAHLASCPNCADALRSARALDQMLQRRPIPAPPAGFTTKTLTRVRRVRWQSDQYLDLAFNVAIGAVVVGMILGGWILLVRTGLVSVGGDAFNLFESAFVTAAHRGAPPLPTYTGAAAPPFVSPLLWGVAARP